MRFIAPAMNHIKVNLLLHSHISEMIMKDFQREVLRNLSERRVDWAASERDRYFLNVQLAAFYKCCFL